MTEFPENENENEIEWSGPEEVQSFGDAIRALMERISKNMDMYDRLGDENYRFFTDPEEREQLADIGARMVEYVRENDINQVAFLDVSARLGYVVFSEAWKQRYPDEPVPERYFFNPLGFETEETMSIEDHGTPRYMEVAAKQFDDDQSNRLSHLLWRLSRHGFGDEDQRVKDFVLEELGGVRSEEEILEDFKHSFPKIKPSESNNSDSPENRLLIVDTCVHSGMSVKPIIGVMEQLGFRQGDNMFIGVIGNRENYSGIDPDFVAVSGRVNKGCYPFGFRYQTEGSVKKTTQRVFSEIDRPDSNLILSFSRAGDERKRHKETVFRKDKENKIVVKGTLIRKEIKKIMQLHS